MAVWYLRVWQFIKIVWLICLSVFYNWVKLTEDSFLKGNCMKNVASGKILCWHEKWVRIRKWIQECCCTIDFDCCGNWSEKLFLLISSAFWVSFKTAFLNGNKEQVKFTKMFVLYICFVISEFGCVSSVWCIKWHVLTLLCVTLLVVAKQGSS